MARTGEASLVPPGTIVGDRYRIRGVLGYGGTAVVYEAEHVQLGQHVALKLLDQAPTPHGARGAFERILLEARAAAQLSSEHAVRVFDVGITRAHQPFVVMEKLVGKDLAREL